MTTQPARNPGDSSFAMEAPMVTTARKIIPIANRFQPRPQQPQTDLWYTEFPLEVYWAIYARQSTPAQLKKHVQSTEMQTEDLEGWLVKKGVVDQHIALYDADLGMSGQLRIDQRPDLLRLVNDIERGMIKAVLVYQISRLFRDLTAIQYNTFAEVCRQHNCILATANGMIFNFNNPMHMKMYRYLAEMAAEYIPQQIKLLHEARSRKARKGVYAGLGPVPSGYIVDYREESRTYLKYIRYEDWSQVIFWLFERYFALMGDKVQFCRELDTMPVLFPDFKEGIDPRNLPRDKRRKVPGGYHLSEKGLLSILTNPVYIGWWIVEGDVISKNNHERIIPEEHEYLFWYAFERLSPYTLTGEKNEGRVRGSYRLHQKRTDPTSGILKKRITSVHGEVFTNTSVRNGTRYVIFSPAQQVRRLPLCEIDADGIDEAFSTRFLQRMEETHDFDQYQRWITEVLQKRDEETSVIHRQLKTLTDRQSAIKAEIIDIRAKIIEKAQSEEEKKRLEQQAAPFITDLRGEYADLHSLKQELIGKLPKPEETEEFQTIRRFADFQTEVRKLIPVWHKKPFPVRFEFVNLFVKEARLTTVSTHWVQLDIVWTHPKWGGDSAYIFRQRGSNGAWSEEEQDILRTHYQTTPKEAILPLLPQKSWSSIRMEARSLGIPRLEPNIYPFPKNLTWSDWQFMQANGIGLLDRNTKFTPLSRRSWQGWRRLPSARQP
jgi:DNA invertase Pin-like site-specific DNA recombinase